MKEEEEVSEEEVTFLETEDSVQNEDIPVVDVGMISEIRVIFAEVVIVLRMIDSHGNLVVAEEEDSIEVIQEVLIAHHVHQIVTDLKDLPIVDMMTLVVMI